MSNLKNKLNNTRVNFSKNIVTSVIIPCAVLILAIVLGAVLGFNKGFDFNGGILVSVVADTADFSETTEYNEFKNNVDEILLDNGVNGSVYLREKEGTAYKDVLVVKIEYTGTSEEKAELSKEIEKDLIQKFYAETSANEIELRHLVSVSSFGASSNLWTVLSAILASIITVLAICVYIFFRSGLNTAVLALISGVVANMLTFALALITRVQISTFSLAIIPFVGILSALATFMFAKKAEKIVKSTDKFERKSNFVLANETVKSNLFGKLLVAITGCLIALVLGLLNITNPVIYFGLLTFEAVVAITYTSLFIIPAIFGLTFVRKFKKEKVKKQKADDNLKEEEVLKETDLDNLVSN